MWRSKLAKARMALISRTSRATRYFGIAVASLIFVPVIFFNVEPISGIPREYVFGTFHLSHISYPDVHMILNMEPEEPTVVGEEIHFTIYRSDTMEPLDNRFIMAYDRNGEILTMDTTDITGHGMKVSRRRYHYLHNY